MIEPPPRSFDLLEPLPQGRLVLQASAGTGKTFTLAGLATRFIAEQGLACSELLVVTFTRAATAELGARLHERLLTASATLSGAAPGTPLGADPLLASLVSADRERRLARVVRALTELDAATITTIHGFAAQVLGLVGSAAGTDPDAALVDDTRTVVAEVCADVLAGAATEPESGALPRYDELHRAVGVALRVPDVRLLPEPDQEAVGPAELRLAMLVRRAVRVVAERRRRAGTLGFDDLLIELRRALAGPRRPAVLEAVRSRFKVVLVDEFQDTDPVQWDILDALFGEPRRGRALILVGDPKQAIYSFRGADVHTYLGAVSGADRRSLQVNWRSDPAALGALETLLDGVTFGDDAIEFVPVQAAETNRDGRLRAESGRALPALSLRLAIGPDLARSPRKPHDISTPDAERAIAADLVAQVRALLEGARLPLRGVGAERHPGDLPEGRPVRPSDVAVLVRSSREAAWVQAALIGGGIPAVMARGGNVLDSPAVEHWRWLLEALLRPSEPARARLFALSWFGGRTPDWVAGASDEDLGEVQDQLASWAETLATAGVVDLVRRLWSETGVVARVLARPDGDRDVTDLGHIGELLQGESSRTASVAGLLALLDAEMPVDADAEAEADVAARRIESEADAVQIMTVWVSKGLEFPIVCCPTLWRKPQEPPVIFEDSELGRVYDVTGAAGWPDSAAAGMRRRRAGTEALGENLRLLYVALTRAQHQTVVWWTRAPGSDATALARVLFARKGADLDPTEFHEARVSLPDDGAALEALDPLVARAGGAISAAIIGAGRPCPHPWVDPQGSLTPVPLQLAVLGRVPDRGARRWSFTAMTAVEAAHADPYDDSLADGGAADERGPGDPDPGERGDGEAGFEADLALGDGGQGVLRDGALSAAQLVRAVADAGGGLALLPAGPNFGTLVHAVLEATDFTTRHLEEQLGAAIDRQLAWRPVDLAPRGIEASPEDGRRLLIEGLRATLDSPLGPLVGGLRLRDVSPADRRDEVAFELLLGRDGYRPSDRDIGRLVLRHLPPGDPLSAWASSVADGAFGVDLAGHLTGSIDAVVRVRDQRDQTERYVVVDYKTNRLHRPGGLPGPGDYHPDRLVEAMVEHHYPLQALLYLVALHRYLRWRLRGYDPAANLGGAAYLFVRGMTGSQVPVSDGRPHGVFAWPVPPSLVAELSDLLDGRPPAVAP